MRWCASARDFGASTVNSLDPVHALIQHSGTGGAGPSPCPSHPRLRRPQGVRSRICRGLLETGRAFLDNDENGLRLRRVLGKWGGARPLLIAVMSMMSSFEQHAHVVCNAIANPNTSSNMMCAVSVRVTAHDRVNMCKHATRPYYVHCIKHMLQST